MPNDEQLNTPGIIQQETAEQSHKSWIRRVLHRAPSEQERQLAPAQAISDLLGNRLNSIEKEGVFTSREILHKMEELSVLANAFQGDEIAMEKIGKAADILNEHPKSMYAIQLNKVWIDYYLGHVRLSQGKYTEALKLVRNIPETKTKKKAIQDIVTAMINKGQLQQTEELIPTLNWGLVEKTAYLQLAEANFKAGNNKEGERLLGKSLEFIARELSDDPDNPMSIKAVTLCLEYLAEILPESQETKTKIREYADRVDMLTQDLHVRLALAVVYANIDVTEKAEEILKSQKNEIAVRALSHAYERAGRINDAEMILGKLEGNDRARALVDFYIKQNKLSDAWRIAKNSNLTSQLKNIAKHLALNGKLHRAKRVLRYAMGKGEPFDKSQTMLFALAGDEKKVINDIHEHPKFLTSELLAILAKKRRGQEITIE